MSLSGQRFLSFSGLNPGRSGAQYFATSPDGLTWSVANGSMSETQSAYAGYGSDAIDNAGTPVWVGNAGSTTGIRWHVGTSDANPAPAGSDQSYRPGGMLRVQRRGGARCGDRSRVRGVLQQQQRHDRERHQGRPDPAGLRRLAPGPRIHRYPGRSGGIGLHQRAGRDGGPTRRRRLCRLRRRLPVREADPGLRRGQRRHPRRARVIRCQGAWRCPPSPTGGSGSRGTAAGTVKTVHTNPAVTTFGSVGTQGAPRGTDYLWKSTIAGTAGGASVVVTRDDPERTSTRGTPRSPAR